MGACGAPVLSVYTLGFVFGYGQARSRTCQKEHECAGSARTVLTAAVDVAFLDAQLVVRHRHDLSDGRQVDVLDCEATSEPVEHCNRAILFIFNNRGRAIWAK